MTIVEVQIHGYRKGHQLLGSSVTLSKDDQAIVDRLSDVAGPLRPKEKFEPYLSAYPLPSGVYYIVARTWQDLTVPRAGCVRTKSILIDSDTWAHSAPIMSILPLLQPDTWPVESDALTTGLDDLIARPLPSVENFNGNELLEALFLEDAQPVVVFDVPEPELIALRLLTALWPDLRRRYALSTFALSPRKIGGRDLDLVFAPSNAKAKFADWPGRRVDGRSSQSHRHRWTGAILRRVFEESFPKLLSDRESDLLRGSNANSAASLRISLLWDELIEKIDRVPTAVLGLLDIANSGMVSNVSAIKSVEPKLAEATRMAGRNLSSHDAWDFVGALIRKVRGYDMPVGRVAIAQLTEQLAQSDPEGAITLLRQPDPQRSIADFIPTIARGLANGSESDVALSLSDAPTDIVVRLMIENRSLCRIVLENDQLIDKLGRALLEVDEDLVDKVEKMLLPMLVDDRHYPVAAPIFNRLDSKGIANELKLFDKENGFQANRLCVVLIEHARDINALDVVRKVLISSSASRRRDALLSLTLSPIQRDIIWLLDEISLNKAALVSLLVDTLNRANNLQLEKILCDSNICDRIIGILPDAETDLLKRIVQVDHVPIDMMVKTIGLLIRDIDVKEKIEIANFALARCLRKRFDGNEADFLSMLFSILGQKINAESIIRAGLGRSVEFSVVRRNMIAFELAPIVARKKFTMSVDEIARVLQTRDVIDIDRDSSEAFARLVLDAQKVSYKIAIDAANWLLQSLLRATSKPVSSLIAAMFPLVFRELQNVADVPAIMRFVPFLYLDRRGPAIDELIDAFMSSSWNPGDLALIAFRCSESSSVLKRVARTPGGENYLEKMLMDLDRLESDCRTMTRRLISEIQNEHHRRNR